MQPHAFTVSSGTNTAVLVGLYVRGGEEETSGPELLSRSGGAAVVGHLQDREVRGQ